MFWRRFGLRFNSSWRSSGGLLRVVGALSRRSSRRLPGPLVLGRAAQQLVRFGSFWVRFGWLGFSAFFGRGCGSFQVWPAWSGSIAQRVGPAIARFHRFRGFIAPAPVSTIGQHRAGLTHRSTGRTSAFLRRASFHSRPASSLWRTPVNSNVMPQSTQPTRDSTQHEKSICSGAA